jgi:hypothetical protein
MNKQLINKYWKEFCHWKDGGNVIFLSNKNNWRNISYFANFWSLKEIGKIKSVVISDEYIEFRKALAEGKIIQFNYGTKQEPDWENCDEVNEEHYFSAYENFYRIKPDKPKFKAGDWTNEKGSLEPIQLTEKYIDTINKVGSWDDFTEWKPQRGEWCLMWKHNKDVVALEQYSNLTEVSLYQSKSKRVYNECMPFTGTLPTHLKDQ